MPADVRLPTLLVASALALAAWSVPAAPLAAQSDDTAGSTEIAPDPVDPGFCPVQPDEPASVEIFADYNGRRYYFCCESCRTDFLSDPARFDSLAQPQESTRVAELPFFNPRPDAYSRTFWGRIGAVILLVRDGLSWVHRTFHLEDRASAILAFAVVVWLVFLSWRWITQARRRTALSPKLSTALWITILVVPSQMAVSYRRHLNETAEKLDLVARDLDSLDDRFTTMTDRDAIHYATFFNFGNPPVPRPSPLPPSLSKTYYRGNDERSEEMFEGGNYRTVTFDLWIEDSEGKRIAPGDEVVADRSSPSPMNLVVRFTRSPSTSSGYFTEKYMRRMYLTMRAGEFLGRDEPVDDRIDWTMTEHERVWIARVPMPRSIIRRNQPEPGAKVEIERYVDLERPLDRGGIVYLCEERYDRDRMIGGRFHYAIRYDLRIENGTVTEASDLWMQATYRGRNFADLQIEDDEWLSSVPIPEKP